METGTTETGTTTRSSPKAGTSAGTSAGISAGISRETAASTRASPRLISSNQVQGTEVYGPDGEHVGEIAQVMIERESGRVAYVVMSFGGFLGFGKDFYPIPWNSLKYDTALDGYRTDITREQVEAAPAYAGGELFDWSDDDWHARIHDYYKTTPSYLP